MMARSSRGKSGPCWTGPGVQSTSPPLMQTSPSLFTISRLQHLLDTNVSPRESKTLLVKLAPKTRYASNATALLGDAAHAMTPFLGTGATLGIEAAYLLAHLVVPALHHGPSDMSFALAQYEETLRPRAEIFVRESEKLGVVSHADGALREARNGILGFARGGVTVARGGREGEKEVARVPMESRAPVAPYMDEEFGRYLSGWDLVEAVGGGRAQVLGAETRG